MCVLMQIQIKPIVYSCFSFQQYMNAKLTIINLPFKSHKCESKIFSGLCQELKKHQYNNNILIIEVYSNSSKAE